MLSIGETGIIFLIPLAHLTFSLSFLFLNNEINTGNNRAAKPITKGN